MFDKLADCEFEKKEDKRKKMNQIKDIVLGILTVVIAFFFREFLIACLECTLPATKKHRILSLGLVAVVLLLLTIFLASS